MPRSKKTSEFSQATVVVRFLLGVTVVGLLLLGLVLAMYRQDVVNQRVMLAGDARHVLDLQHELLSSDLSGVQADLLFLANQKVLQQFLTDQAAGREELEQEYINFAENQDIYDQIRFLDPSGKELVRINYNEGQAVSVPEDELQSKATRYYFQESLSLAKGEVWVSPFDLNVEHGQIEQPIQPVIRFSTPVLDAAGERQGLLVLNYLGTPMLDKLREISTSFRGETMLLNPEGEYLQAPNPEKEWGWLLGHDTNFREDFPTVWQETSDWETEEFLNDGDQFTFRILSTGLRLDRQSLTTNTESPTLDASGLVLAARVSSAVANAQSRELLNRLLLMFAGVMVVVAFLSYYWARSVELRQQHERQIADSEARLRQLSRALLETQEAERRSISRALHDELGQMITAIRLDLGILAKQEMRPMNLEHVSRIKDEADQLLESLHEVASKTRPSVLDDLGLRDAMESFLAEYQKRTGITVESRFDFDQERIPVKIGENAYRIALEALWNAAQHAQVESVQLLIEERSDQLRIEVQDHGVGFVPQALGSSKRLGILGMRERAELLEGSFDLLTTPGQGTQVVVQLPLTDPSHSDPD